MQHWILSLALTAAAMVGVSHNAVAEPARGAGATPFDAALASQEAPAVIAAETPAEADARTLRALAHVRSAMAEQAVQVADNTSSLVTTAMGFLGVKYRRGGNSAETGFDCSGFVRAIYQKTAGLVLPRRAKDQAAHTEVIDKQDLQPGDLVFFNTMRRAFSHVGIYLGDGKFIHSPRTGQEVRVESLQASYWKQRFNGARRVAVAEVGESSTLALSNAGLNNR